MSFISNRDFSLALLLVAILFIPSLYLSEDPLFMVELMLGMGVVMWIIWHISGRRIVGFLARRDVKRRDAKLISPATYEPEGVGIKGLLRLSLYPNLLSFSLLSLAYEIMGLEVGSPSKLVDFMTNAFLILPFTILIPAIWVVENSGIVVVRPGDYPRGLAYMEFVGDFIDIGSIIGLAITVGLALRGSEDLLDALTWFLAFIYFFFVVMLAPSLLATTLYLRLSLLKAIQHFRQGILLYDVDIRVEYRCPVCNSPVSLDEKYCSECGRVLIE